MAKVDYHPNYDKYVEMIVAHPNYKGLYYERNKDGKVGWVVTGKSPKGQKRQAWWDAKCKELNVPIQKGCYAKVARMIHPTGKHVCQCCGKERSIFYEYPTKNTVTMLNKILGICIDKDSDEERVQLTIRQLIEKYCLKDSQMYALASYFNLPRPKNVQDLIGMIYKEHVEKESSKFSPGVMCNPPDRYNGFHSYALCCRTKNDTGRHTINMQTYTQDRRAYEEWSDGDYNLANRLMGEFRKQPPMECPMCGRIDKMSADHIGPISLGFCHSTHFAPMCSSCNSSKNNRFTLADVQKLIELEDKGETVISWHSKYIWDLVKHNISDDREAKLASSLMAKCHQNILYTLALIYKATGTEFLSRYLHPEYSMYDYRFENFDLSDLSKMRVIKHELDSKNKRNNQERYVRIAFESLEEFSKKDNRKVSFLLNEKSILLKNIIKLIKEEDFKEADIELKSLIQKMSHHIVAEGWVVMQDIEEYSDSGYLSAAEEEVE